MVIGIGENWAEESLGMMMRLVIYCPRRARHVHLWVLHVHGSSHVEIVLP